MTELIRWDEKNGCEIPFDVPTHVERYTKKELIARLQEIAEYGWIKGTRKGNCGSAGNTLEDLLGIVENNLPIPNAAEWELKTHQKNSSSLLTLLHSEPSALACKHVPKILLPKYGWKHKDAGVKYPADEMSFRQTISGLNYSDRGFKVIVNREEKKIEISFNADAIDESKHGDWKQSVKDRVGLEDLIDKPYWGFDDLKSNMRVKLRNCFYVEADSKKINGELYFKFDRALMLKDFDFNKFLDAIESGRAYVDFDARTGHNHGTKFRIQQNLVPELYAEVKVVVGEKTA